MGFRNFFIIAVGLTLAACASAPPPRNQQNSSSVYPTPQVRCPDCGRVERIQVSQVSGGTDGKSAVLGGIVGGVASGTASTGYGPVQRAVTPNYRISVRMDDGRHLVFIQGTISPNLREGSTVRIENGRAVLLR